MPDPATLLVNTVAATAKWQAWTALGETASKARIHYPSIEETAIASLPAAIIIVERMEVAPGRAGGRMRLRVIDAQASTIEGGAFAMLGSLIDLMAQMADVARAGTADKIIIREPLALDQEPQLRPQRDQGTHKLMVAEIGVEFGAV
jgi:hypothetical protein